MTDADEESDESDDEEYLLQSHTDEPIHPTLDLTTHP